MIRFRNAALVVALMLATACGGFHTPPNLSPVGQAAWKADRAVLGFEAVVDGSTGLNKIQVCDKNVPPICHALLSKANTDIILDVSRRSVVTLRATPDGWRATVSTGLTEIRSKLDDSGKAQISAWLGVLDALLKEK
jgi:hypothetical protein